MNQEKLWHRFDWFSKGKKKKKKKKEKRKKKTLNASGTLLNKVASLPINNGIMECVMVNLKTNTLILHPKCLIPLVLFLSFSLSLFMSCPSINR